MSATSFVSGTMTRLGTVSPAEKLTFEAFGLGAPSGYAVRWPLFCGCVTVRLMTAAAAPAGTFPDRLSRSTPSAATGPVTPVPFLVSKTRVGVPGW